MTWTIKLTASGGNVNLSGTITEKLPLSVSVLGGNPERKVDPASPERVFLISKGENAFVRGITGTLLSGEDIKISLVTKVNSLSENIINEVCLIQQGQEEKCVQRPLCLRPKVRDEKTKTCIQSFTFNKTFIDGSTTGKIVSI